MQSEIEGRDVPARVNRPLVVTLIAIYEFVGAGAGHAVGDREKFAALPVQRLNRGFRVVAHCFPSAGIGNARNSRLSRAVRSRCRVRREP